MIKKYFFTCHYSKTVWLTENLSEINITHYEKIFSHIKQKCSHFEKRSGIKNIFCVTDITALFSPRYITLKLNQKTISKISNYLTKNAFLKHPRNLPLKEIAFHEFKLKLTKSVSLAFLKVSVSKF